jgi:prevent-host-death family protein
MSVSTIHEAKTNLSRLIQKAERGEEVVIARGKTPVAKIVPIKKAKKKRTPGMFKGVFKVGPEFFEPLPEDELRLWSGEGE